MSSFRSLPRSIRFIVNNHILYTAWVKPIPKSVRWSFLAFVAALALEGWPIGEDITLPKIFGLLFFACYMAHSGLPLRLNFPPIPAALWGFLAYFLMYAVSAMSIQEAGIRAYVTRLFTLLQFFVLFWFSSDLLRDPEFTKKSLLTYAITYTGLALGALAGVPGLASDGADARAVTALEFGPNTVALLAACAALIIIGYCINEKMWSTKRKALLLALTLPLFATMVQTGSRSGIIAFVIGLAVFFIPQRSSKKWKIAFFIGLGSICGIIYLMFQDPLTAERFARTIEEGNTAGRGDIYMAALEMFSERPLAGWGAQQAFEELGLRLGLFGRRDAHNIVLYLLIEVGLIGAVPFLLGIWFCFRSAVKSRGGQLGLLPLSLTLTVLIYNMAHSAIVLKLFWLILGLAVAGSAGGRQAIFRRVRAISEEGPKEVDGVGSAKPFPAPSHS